MAIADAVRAIEGKFKILTKNDFRGETTITIEREVLHDLALFCRDSLGFTYLVDISSVDHFGEEPRFEMVYELVQFEKNEHLRIKFRVSEDDLSVATVSDIWPTADWHEREVFDMMGIRFTAHPDLRRILMWEGYPYFPLRKDFPLAGRPSDVPGVAFTKTAPLEGGPFVTVPSTATTKDREPRARPLQ